MTSGVAGSARHGTMSGYTRHYREHDPVCGPCRQANSDRRRARYLRMKRDYRITMAEALAELGLPPDRIPQEATP